MPPPNVWFGHGFDRLAAYLTEAGAHRVLVLTSDRRRFVAELTRAISGENREIEVFDGVRVHVPAEVVEEAAARLAAHRADTILAIGGGAAIGLGKALRLQAPGSRFVAIPTTYAGSEMTSMYGITTGTEKRTGRDDAVRPDLVIYDVDLTRDLPTPLSVQSLCNALAHVVSVVSAGSLEGTARADGLAAAAVVVHAIEELLLAPRSARAREAALRGASACATAFDRGKPGTHHALAHLLGGALRVEHAALHALLLPHFVAHLRATTPAVVDELERAIWPAGGGLDLDTYLHDTLVRAGASVALTALGPAGRSDAVDAVSSALSTRPELPHAIATDALHGLRPSGRLGRLDLDGEPHALLAGCPVDRARVIVLALHGRGAEAGTIARRYAEIGGHDRDTAIVGLRAEHGVPRWYEMRYGQPGAGRDPEVGRAIARVEAALAALRRRAADAGTPDVPIVLAGFSQGSCLALEVAARTTVPIAAVIAPCGARIGQPAEWPARTWQRGPRVLVGAAAGDKWIARPDLDATIRWFRTAGCVVDDHSGPGDRHEITLRQRIAARELIREARGDAPSPPAPTGFGNTLIGEALPGAVPEVQNTPRLPPHGLYPEQLSGTGFTAERARNQRTWMYRVRPSAQRRAAVPLAHDRVVGVFDGPPAANLFAVPPLALPADDQPRDFVDGLHTICGAGSAALRRGYAFHTYVANRSMEHRALYDADGDLLIIPEHGTLSIVTELGVLDAPPGHVALIPRGIAFSVLLPDRHPVRGYVAEPFGRHFRLPERGPVGANGLAEERHFRTARPWFEDRLSPDTRIVSKLGGKLYEGSQDHSPFDVAGWHGNYLPWTYDLDRFLPVGNTRFDHGDPSIYTVLSAPLDEQGSHALDFVVFPPRIDVTIHSFRPPFFHRNVVTEINGIVREHAPAGSPFVPGCTFVTPCLVPHGVSGRLVEQSRTISDAEADRPTRLGIGAIWFQLESVLPPVPTTWATGAMLADWPAQWGSHRSYFTPSS